MLSCMCFDLADARLSHEILKSMSEVPRFKTSLFFLLDAEKKVIRQLFSKLEQHVTISQSLKSSYMI